MGARSRIQDKDSNQGNQSTRGVIRLGILALFAPVLFAQDPPLTQRYEKRMNAANASEWKKDGSSEEGND